MPSDKSTRKQRHQAAIKPQKGKAVRGAQATEFVKGAGYRKSEFIGGKKFFTPMSPDPTSSGAGGDVTNITVSGGGDTIQGAVLADGTVPFNSTQVGISPTETAHIATKGYVDSNAAAFELTGNVTGGTSGATAVATTIANDAVTYAKMQNIAGRRFLGRNTNSSGDAEEITTAQAVTLLALESGSADEYLCGNGVFREVGASVEVAGLNDTSIQSIADDHMLVYTYISENHAGNLWKNESVASAIRPKLSATAPLAYNNSTGDFTHQTGAGKNHVPTGGSSGQFLKYSSSGVATWATPSYTVDTHRAIHTSPNSSASTISISSSWAHSHDADANAHHARYNDAEAVSAVNDTSSIATTCDTPNVQSNWNAGSGGAHILNKPNIQYTSAIGQSELRSTIGYGNQGLVPATGNSGEFLSYNGTFDEISVTLDVLGLSDTAFSGLADGHVLYKDGSYWKNLVSTGTGNNVRSASPTFTGTVNAATITCSGELQATKIRLTSGTDAALNTTNPAFMVGAVGGTNVVIDQNEVMARNNGSASQLHFNADGGGVTFFNNTADKKCEIDTAGSIIGKNLKAREDVIAYYNASDRRLKNNIKTIPDALAKVMSLTGITFKYKSDGKKSTGLIAQDLEKVLPEAVFENEDYKHIRYEIIAGLLVEAIKELNNKGCCCGSPK